MRALFRLVFTLILLAIALGVGYYLGYRAGSGHDLIAGSPVIGTSGSRAVGEAGSTIERKLSEAGSQASAFFSDAALTTKIKSKMGLDDHLAAHTIHVSTTDGVVTLTGSVESRDERARAEALARDTKGVKSVVDRLEIGK